MKRDDAIRTMVLSAVALVPAAAHFANQSTEPGLTLGLFVLVWALAVSVAGVVVHLSRTESPRSGHTAGCWERASAFAIDFSGLLLLELLCVPIFGSAAQWIYALAAATYFIGAWTLTGQTAGMAMVGIQVVRTSDGARLSIVDSARRFAGLVLGIACLWIGVIWLAFTPERRGWHDIIGRSRVIAVR